VTLARAIVSGGGGGELQSPQFLGDQLTLYQPGGQIMITYYTTCPPGFSDLAKGLLAMTGFAVYALEIQP
jgi:hypothetical protein